MSAKLQNLIRAAENLLQASKIRSKINRPAAVVALAQAIKEAKEPRDKEAQYYFDAAKDQYHSEGEIEIDDDAVVSLSEDTDYESGHRGAYVEAWVWVDNPELKIDEDNIE